MTKTSASDSTLLITAKPLIPVKPSRVSLLSCRENRLIVAFLVVFWLAITIPIVFFSQWFPLDMPALFGMGENLERWLFWILSPYNGSGRYFPLYWLYHTSQYVIFGSNVWPYFVTLNFIFLAGTLILSRVIWKMTGSVRYAAAFFVVAYLGTPIAENLSTIGKGEPLAYALIASVIALTHHLIVNMTLRPWAFAGIAISFVCAIWIKETSLVVAGFAMSGFCFSWLLGRWRSNFKGILGADGWSLTLAALFVGWLLSKVPYVVAPKIISSAYYTDYQITRRLIRENLEFYLLQQPDVFLIGAIATVLLAFSAFYACYRGMTDQDSAPLRLLVLTGGTCAMAWAYCVAMLLWRWPMVYYMLLPSIIFKFCLIYALYFVSSKKIIAHWLASAIKISLLLIVISSAVAFYYVATSQIAYSRLFTDALHRYHDISKNNGDLTLENYPFFAEQINGTQDFVTNQLRMTTKVKGIGEIINPSVLVPDLMELLQITQVDLDKNFTNIPRKGEYVLVFTGSKLATWFLRGVTPYYVVDSELKLENIYEMELVAEKTLNTNAVYLNEWTSKLDYGSTFLGYKLYRVLSEKPRFIWRGRYPDGWVGTSAFLHVNDNYHHSVKLSLSAPDFTLPNTVSIKKNGQHFRDVTFNNSDEIILVVDEGHSLRMNLEFEVTKSISPRELKMSKDDRKLAVRIALVR